MKWFRVAPLLLLILVAACSKKEKTAAPKETSKVETPAEGAPVFDIRGLWK